MNDNRYIIEKIEIEGFKSIAGPATILPHPELTLLIGANGSGKSNLLSFFEMLNNISTENLQNYIALKGFPDSFLYGGAAKTTQIKAALTFTDGLNRDTYSFTLTHAAKDMLLFTSEEVIWQREGESQPMVVALEPGKKESALRDPESMPEGRPQQKVVKVVSKLLGGCRFYQFHDTSATSNLRGTARIEDSTCLKSNGGNLAALLYRMKNERDTVDSFKLIEKFVAKAFPQFGAFILEPDERNGNFIKLRWREKQFADAAYTFEPHQLSDGTLRFVALATLLMQPKGWMPNTIVIDEPELGLHPKAISLLGVMLRRAAQYSQIIVATQSERLLDEADIDQVMVVERDPKSGVSTFRKLSDQDYAHWLQEYTASELWEKNVLGGMP